MGKLEYLAYAMILVTLIVGLLMMSAYQLSNDVNKTQFINYTSEGNFSQLDNANLSYADTNDSKTNIQLAAEAISTDMIQGQKGIQSTDAATKILSAFGAVSFISLDVLGLLYAVVIDSINVLLGIGGNLSFIPAPWNYFAIIVGYAVALLTVFGVFAIAAALLKWYL